MEKMYLFQLVDEMTKKVCHQKILEVEKNRDQKVKRLQFLEILYI